MAGKMWQEAKYFDESKDQLALKKQFSFKNFTDALAFVNKVGELAEHANHHPDINLGWGYVTIWLTSHDQKKITDKDHDLAAEIDTVASNHED